MRRKKRRTVYIILPYYTSCPFILVLTCLKPGAIARSVAMSLRNQEAPRSILASSTSFREDLFMKLFLRPFFLFCWFKKSSCQLMAKGCALSTGYLPRGGLPRNRVDRILTVPTWPQLLTLDVKHLPKQTKQNLYVKESDTPRVYSPLF